MNPFLEYSEALHGAHIEKEFEKFYRAFHAHERIIILGNGGSNSVASHISQDYMKFHRKKVSILSDPSMLTMLTNDFGYENAYQKFLEYYVEKDTLVIIMSSGGESKNMLRAHEWCEQNKLDNSLRINSSNALWNYYIDSNDYGVVECVHQIFLHSVI